MTNAEVYGALALILIELQRINARLDDSTTGTVALTLEKENTND